MRTKILIGLVIILVTALFVESAYLLQIKYDKAKHQSSLWEQGYFLDPFKEIDSLLSNGSLFNFNDNLFESFSLNTDIQETDKYYLVRMSLPGMEKEKINVKLEDNLLVISGKENTKRHGSQSFKTFKKVIPIPKEIKVDEVTTKYKDDTLIVKLPKVNPDRPSIEPKIKLQV